MNRDTLQLVRDSGVLSRKGVRARPFHPQLPVAGRQRQPQVRANSGDPPGAIRAMVPLLAGTWRCAAPALATVTTDV